MTAKCPTYEVRYEVRENGKPCTYDNFPTSKDWNNAVFTTKEEAYAYACEWLEVTHGMLDFNIFNVPYNYNGYGDLIHIVETSN